MANEATVLSLTTVENATSVQNTAGGDDVDVATANANAVPASIDVGFYFLKAKYEGTDGRSLLLRQLEKFKARILKGAWPAI